MANTFQALEGIHHITAITDDAQKNADFYTGVLGLRLVKKTVNFDDPGSYHLYYGDWVGSPGTLLTFFVWPGGKPGRTGAGEPTAMALEVPAGALPWWKERFAAQGIQAEQGSRFGAEFLSVADPNGLKVELVESADAGTSGYEVRRIHSITLGLANAERSAALYTGELTFRGGETEAGRTRYSVGGQFVDVVAGAATQRGRMGAGTIHHVAFRTPTDDAQGEWMRKLLDLGLQVSPVMDRQYFHSIYFREPGGVLFEIATDGPGMPVDESVEQLGQALKLPPQYESIRNTIEGVLPPFVVPAQPAVSAQAAQSAARS
jgi:glyoxalase family protein